MRVAITQRYVEDGSLRREFEYCQRQLFIELSNTVQLISQQSQRLNMKGNEDYKNVFDKDAEKLVWIKDEEIKPEREFIIKSIIDLNSVFILNSCVAKINATKDFSLKELREQVEKIFDVLKSNNSDPQREFHLNGLLKVIKSYTWLINHLLSILSQQSLLQEKTGYANIWNEMVETIKAKFTNMSMTLYNQLKEELTIGRFKIPEGECLEYYLHL